MRTLAAPLAGPCGLMRVDFEASACQLLLNQSEHHSHTFPDTLKRPRSLGSKESTGAVPRCPSRPKFNVGNRPCQTLHICFPLGVKELPHGYLCMDNPPRAAHSHSASVGNRFPAQLLYATASFHDTCTTGWFIRLLIVDLKPSGLRQQAPSIANHQGTCMTRLPSNFLRCRFDNCPLNT